MNKQEKKWKVYKHTGPTGKVYIGITMQNLSRRWRDGKAYWGSIKFYNAIKKYGWKSFKHEQLADQLTFEEASAIRYVACLSRACSIIFLALGLFTLVAIRVAT